MPRIREAETGIKEIKKSCQAVQCLSNKGSKKEKTGYLRKGNEWIWN